MTRAEFMGRLRRGLVGMPTAAAADIAADYDIHFEDGVAPSLSIVVLQVCEPCIEDGGLWQLMIICIACIDCV